MNILLRYYALQAQHYWRNLSIRFRIELLLIALLFTAFFSEKATRLFGSWLTTGSVTSFGLTIFALNVLLLLYAATVPFIYYKLLPRQPGFHILRVQPLNRISLMLLMILSAVKYHLIPLLLMLPVLIALALTTNFSAVILFLLGMFICPVYFILLIHVLNVSVPGYVRPVTLYFATTGAYFILLGLAYLFFAYYTVYQLGMILLPGIWFYQKRSIWDRPVLWHTPVKKSRSNPLSRIRYPDFPRILRPLTAREILVSLRNVRYLRLKLFSTLLYILLLTAGYDYFSDSYINFVSAVTLVFIWIHYSAQFNEKYVQPEIRVFMRTMPLKFFPLVLARIISELIYILLLLILQNIILLIAGIPAALMLYLSAGVLIFATAVFYVIAVLRILFYDNPRLAGYAYHFLIIFSLMMTANFYLVGPVVILALLAYLTLLSRRQIVK